MKKLLELPLILVEKYLNFTEYVEHKYGFPAVPLIMLGCFVVCLILSYAYMYGRFIGDREKSW